MLRMEYNVKKAVELQEVIITTLLREIEGVKEREGKGKNKIS